jgi:ADP-ribosyl-[dinitrogen reductase] hydrolase
MTLSVQSHILGGLYGSLIGDALGVPVEFSSRAACKNNPVTEMRAYGMHHQPAGTWSDDGSLLLCAVESLVEKGFDPQDMGERFLRWFDAGHWAAHGLVFDIGNATRNALDLISMGTPSEKAGGTGEHDNGNGSLMRILPVSLASATESDWVIANRLGTASGITHRHARSQMSCVFHAFMVRALLNGLNPQNAYKQAQACFVGVYEQCSEIVHFKDLLDGRLSTTHESKIDSGGYVIDTLTASLWSLLTTSSFAECVLKAVNLGEDTDTTGCAAGGLAGVYYGIEAIPSEWLGVLPRQEALRDLFERFTYAINH